MNLSTRREALEIGSPGYPNGGGAKTGPPNQKTPLINLRFIVMKHNEHEIPRLEGIGEVATSGCVNAQNSKPCQSGPLF